MDGFDNRQLYDAIIAAGNSCRDEGGLVLSMPTWGPFRRIIVHALRLRTEPNRKERALRSAWRIKICIRLTQYSPTRFQSGETICALSEMVAHAITEMAPLSLRHA
jgi:hypothetical protein